MMTDYLNDGPNGKINPESYNQDGSLGRRIHEERHGSQGKSRGRKSEGGAVKNQHLSYGKNGVTLFYRPKTNLKKRRNISGNAGGFSYYPKSKKRGRKGHMRANTSDTHQRSAIHTVEEPLQNNHEALNNTEGGNGRENPYQADHTSLQGTNEEKPDLRMESIQPTELDTHVLNTTHEQMRVKGDEISGDRLPARKGKRGPQVAITSHHIET